MNCLYIPHPPLLPPSCFHLLLRLEMLLQRLWSPSCSGVSPLCCSAHPDASGGAITNPHMQSRSAMHMIPFAFQRCFCVCFFMPLFLSVISNDTLWGILQVEELIVRVVTETPVWLEQLIASDHSPFNFAAAQGFFPPFFLSAHL